MSFIAILNFISNKLIYLVGILLFIYCYKLKINLDKEIDKRISSKLPVYCRKCGSKVGLMDLSDIYLDFVEICRECYKKIEDR